MTTENRDRWLAQLYEENYRRVYRLAVYRLRQGSGRIEEAEDVVQEVFCRAIQHEVWQHENPVSWLIVATNNVCSEMYSIDLVSVAKACGYPNAVCVDNFDDLDKELESAKGRDALSLIEVKCSIGAREDLGRPTTTAFL